MQEFDTVIGLEVHVQLNTLSKIFCSCSTKFENPPNTNICPVCCGYPGVLPVFNKRALELAIRVALALKCKINKKIYFERKNYFYPDLPKNYQISQYKMPLGENGELSLRTGKTIGITRVHLEEDAGKLIHKENYSLVDLNRTGTPLLEIVSNPDITSPQEAFGYLTCLKLALQYIGASECNMEKGSLRCDANVSLKNKGASALGVKVELKNMNTFKGVRDALEYEIARQSKVLGEGGKIFQETRLWDGDIQRTEVMRSKEEAHDYRYFPEPDLLDFLVEEEFMEKEKPFVKELPHDRYKRFLDIYKLQESDTDVLISEKFIADYFEEAVKEFNEPKKICNFIIGPFLEQVNTFPDRFQSVKLSAQNFSKIVKYFSTGLLNNLAAKKVLVLSINNNNDIDEIIKKEGLSQVSNESELKGLVEEAIKENQKAVKEYMDGKEQAIMFLVGSVMKKTKGKANPKVVKELLEKAIK
ncbi:MAG: Asp-tRNA(Asn)/Glu-tRNA(Gln) amidotransferase subunit GatB [Candidatus Omnitrophica bacterium]|jgi:aspartyl-tRNA(Asn)/glutamyl-tRNA(Gln) amidotransferase subunit B|nr:Asp-tRNA(Asn)/Glu-tRNA(Gln) amidotransferase subunit GatB [Candidatus Omnitrophota bacterium]